VRILFDQGTPAPLRNFLRGHEITTAHERGWGTLQNGDLLRAAEAAGFEAIITTDQNLRYQQSLSERHLAIIVLLTTNWPLIRPHVSLVADAVTQLVPKAYIELSFPQKSAGK
jgi:predicted nuclease of predicted toxin-antitoxin system